jgi:uncharacterized membrane protein
MERMLVVVFDDESKAYEGSHALKQLDADGSIAIHAEAVIKKNADGTITVKQANDEFPIRSIGGTAIGSLIGLLEGPVGMAVGAYAGALAGVVGDLHVVGVDADFVDDVAKTLNPGKCAVIAEISEEWITPVDTRMEAVGGTVFREAREAVEEEQRAREIAKLRAEIDQLKAEYTKARADRKAKLKAQIDKLEAKLKEQVEQARQESERMKQEMEAKVHALQEKAAKTQGEIKATFNARVKSIRQHHEQSQAKLKHALAQQLTAAAAKLEPAGSRN